MTRARVAESTRAYRAKHLHASSGRPSARRDRPTPTRRRSGHREGTPLRPRATRRPTAHAWSHHRNASGDTPGPKTSSRAAWSTRLRRAAEVGVEQSGPSHRQSQIPQRPARDPQLHDPIRRLRIRPTTHRNAPSGLTPRNRTMPSCAGGTDIMSAQTTPAGQRDSAPGGSSRGRRPGGIRQHDPTRAAYNDTTGNRIERPLHPRSTPRPLAPTRQLAHPRTRTA